MEELGWRQVVAAQLKKRNREQTHCFEELIRAHNKHLDSASSLRTKNVELEVEAARVRQENLDIRAGLGDSSGSDRAFAQSNERALALEKKMFTLQEELTQLHRHRGSNAQKVVELNELLQEREQEMARKEASLAEALQAKAMCDTNIEQLKRALSDLEHINQTLKDEMTALHLLQDATEAKLKAASLENQDLIQRWMKLKGRKADRLNETNDQDRLMRKQHMESEISDAMETNQEKSPKAGGDRPRNKSVLESLLGSFRGAMNAVPPPRVEPLNTNSLPAATSLKCVSSCLPAKAAYKLDAHDGEVAAVRFSSNAGHMATASDRKVKLWRFASYQNPPEVIGTLQGCNGAVTSLDFDPGEMLLLAGSNDYSSRVWGVSDQRLRHALTGHSNKVTAAKFLGDAGKVVSGSNDRTLKVWDLRNKACIRTIFAGSSCNDLATGEVSGNDVISGHFDKRIRFWDTRTDSNSNEISLQGRITSLDLSPDRTSLLCSSRDDVLKIIDLRMHLVAHSFAAEGFRLSSDCTRAAFSPDGHFVACGSSDGSIYVWNVQTGALEHTSPKEHSGAVLVCTWHPSGEYMLSGERSKRAIVWRE